MNVSLDDVFDKILKSEQESKAEQEYLQKIKNDITETGNKAIAVEQDLKLEKKKILQKIDHLGEREVVLNSLLTRQKILTERNTELKLERDNEEKKMRELKTKLAEMRRNFCRDVMEFHNEFRLKRSCKKETTCFPTSLETISINQKSLGSLTIDVEDLTPESNAKIPLEFHKNDGELDTENWFDDDVFYC